MTYGMTTGKKAYQTEKHCTILLNINPLKGKAKNVLNLLPIKKLRNQLNTVEQLIGKNFLRQTVIFNDNYYTVAILICEGILSKSV